MLELTNKLYKTNRLFSSNNKSLDLLIRPLERDEFDLMGKVAAKFYQDRFYNEETIKKQAQRIYNEKELEGMTQEEIQEIAGNISILFPNLKPNDIYGQSEENFLRYWKEQKDNPDFKAFVAIDKETNQICGFVKGDFKYVDLQDFPHVTFPEGINPNKILSIGSLYVDPECKGKGAGKALASTFMLNSLAENNFDYSGFLTDCFWRNNSQFFFNKCGAERIGFCDIPDRYVDKDGKTNIQNITGEVMFWTPENVENFLKNKVKITSPYSRKNPDYKTMEKAKGSMPEYLKLKQKDNSKNYLNELVELGKDFDPFIIEKERSFMYSCE